MFSQAEAENKNLATRIGDGDAFAETELVHIFAPRISMMCKVRIRDREAVRDLVQEILMAVIGALRKNQIKEPGKLPAFVAGTARNLINSYLRNQARRPPHEALSPELERAVVDSESCGRDEEKRIHHAMQALNDDDRQLLSLILTDGLKPKQIADRLGVTAEVVRTRKVRAIRRLADLVLKMSRN